MNTFNPLDYKVTIQNLEEGSKPPATCTRTIYKPNNYSPDTDFIISGFTKELILLGIGVILCYFAYKFLGKRRIILQLLLGIYLIGIVLTFTLMERGIDGCSSVIQAGTCYEITLSPPMCTHYTNIIVFIITIINLVIFITMPLWIKKIKFKGKQLSL